MRNMTARAAAKAAGEKTYTTGAPCKNGHTSPRATVSGSCLQCTAEAGELWKVRNQHKLRGYSAAYKAKNREVVLEKDRLLKARKRAENPEQHKLNSLAQYREQMKSQGKSVRDGGRLSITELVLRLQEQYSGKLLYLGEYKHMNTNATFLCTIHNNPVAAHPHNVLRGANPCPKCNHMKSAGEAEVAKFLSIFTPVIQRDRTTIAPKELDILLPQHNLAVEYCGMYWHSHGDVGQELANKHKHKEKFDLCQQASLRLLTIYETEWQERKPAIKRLLRNAIGKSHGKLMARKCELRKVTHQEASTFYEKYHPQGGAGHGEHYGLYWRGKLVACMRFVLGANDRGAASKRVWTLGRYATRITVAGGASRLFKAFLSEYQPSEVKSFSDNRYFAGGMYEQLGFVLEEDVVPDYQVWSMKLGLRPKSHYQRRSLPQRLKDHGVEDTFDPEHDPRTEREMTFAMGARRLYDCGKKRWVYKSLAQTQ